MTANNKWHPYLMVVVLNKTVFHDNLVERQPFAVNKMTSIRNDIRS